MTDKFEEPIELGPEDIKEEPHLHVEAERLPAVVEARVIESTPSALLPAVQAAAAAATGFVAGAATLALVRRLNARRLARPPRPGSGGYGRTRTLLVHVRVLD